MIDTLIDGVLYITNGSGDVTQEAIDQLGISAVMVVAKDIMGYLFRPVHDELCTLKCGECKYRKCPNNKVYCYNNCSKCHAPCGSCNDKVITADVYEYPILDDNKPGQAQLVKIAANTVHTIILDGRRVLITCKGGMSRSSIVAICAIHAASGYDLDKARKLVEDRHPAARMLNVFLLEAAKGLYAKEEAW